MYLKNIMLRFVLDRVGYGETKAKHALWRIQCYFINVIVFRELFIVSVLTAQLCVSIVL